MPTVPTRLPCAEASVKEQFSWINQYSEISFVHEISLACVPTLQLPSELIPH